MFGYSIVSKKYLATLLSEVARLHGDLWIANYHLRTERELNAVMTEECEKAGKKLHALSARLSEASA